MDSELVYDSTIGTDKDVRKKPFLTVCLSTYRFESTVVRALESLLEQTYKDFEIVISDDASPDGTVAAALDILRTYAGAMRIRLYRSSENRGIVGNRLTAMNYAEGDLLVQTDGDDFSMPQRLEKIATFWQSLNEKPSILATNALRWYEASGTAGAPVHDIGGIGIYPPGDPVYGQTLVFSAGYAVSRRLFEAFKDVVPQVKLIADDPVFARRAALLDGLIYMPEPIFYYGTSTESASGGGVSGRDWIQDRIHRWDLLLRDIAHIMENGLVPPVWQRQISQERRKMVLDFKAIDCHISLWGRYWIKMWVLSPREAVAMLKKRVKLIMLGSVNATWRRG